MGAALLLTLIMGGANNVSAQAIEYKPQINPADFSTVITNPYFSLPVDLQLTYEGETEKGTERIQIDITGQIREVMGVMTLIYRDRVWIDDELVEDTSDYLAQHKNGNVWYFGEDVDNYENGKVVDHRGSWRAGVSGAQPGIWVMQSPAIGESYRQEYYSGEAEDVAEVVSITENVTVPYGSFTNCLKTKDSTPLEPDVYEYKYYCPQAGALVLEENPQGKERVELVAKQIVTTRTYLYVDVDGEIRSVEAPTPEEAIRTAPEIAPTSGVILTLDGEAPGGGPMSRA